MRHTAAWLASGHLYRAVDSTGATIDFLLTTTRDAAAAKRFMQKTLGSPDHPRPRVINVDRSPSYPKATMNMIRKGQVRWLAKDDIAGHAAFFGHLVGLTTA